MDTALCTSNNTTYNAFDFNLLPEPNKSFLRQHLKCVECKGKASFRKASTDNKPPCFSAKHIGNCSKKNSSKSVSNKPGNTQVSKIIANPQAVKLLKTNFFTTASSNTQAQGTINLGTKKGHNRNSYTLDPVKNTTKPKTLRKILNQHLEGALSNTGLKIYINNNIFQLKEILIDWDKMNIHNRTGFYCGYIRSSNKRIWLNTNSNSNLSILLDDVVADIIWNSLPYKSGSWNNGVPVIVYGTPQVSSNGKIFIKLSDIEDIYISKKHYKNI
ncbi:hypothetical protein ACFPRA_21935 [Sporosarcina soli]|uniref:Uncharacterized protein n=1 Tax=Sporosarcina soli TaxID=334736 RepID=A0ABW0TPX8_9BACL